MAAPVCVARAVNIAGTLRKFRVQCHAWQFAQELSTRNKRKKIGTRLSPKQDPYVPFVDGEPVQQDLQQANRSSTKMTTQTNATNVISVQSERDDTSNKTMKREHTLDQRRNTSKTDVLSWWRAKIQGQSKSDKQDITSKIRSEQNHESVLNTMPQTDVLSQRATHQQVQDLGLVMEKDEIIKTIHGVSYTKLTDENDRRLVGTMVRVKSNSRKEENKEILVEGYRSVFHALKKGFKPLTLYYADEKFLQSSSFNTELVGDAEIYHVKQKNLRIWTTDKQTHIAGVFQKPENPIEMNQGRTTIPVTVICDYIGMNDGIENLVHIAAVVGCEKIILTEKNVDVWHPSIVDAAMGAHFTIPIIQNTSWSSIMDILPKNDKHFYLVGTDQKIERKILQGRDPIDILDLIEKAKKQELFDDDESDTVALGHREKIPDIYKQAFISMQPYHKVDYTEGHAVIVISGHQSGLSLPLRRVMHDNFGLGLAMPRLEGLPKFKSGLCGAISLMEVAKQFLQKAQSNEYKVE